MKQVNRYCHTNLEIVEPNRFRQANKNGKIPFNTHDGYFEVDLDSFSVSGVFQISKPCTIIVF